ncbi:heme exporter protein CcmD [Roseibium album]|uniref:Heme exporter protein D n=1 Tax=Roseibium album TaxID=311410 RepID=A0A0M7ABW1_9HYPH|nr:heme exporter protein CcmD [Roseibium album]CTQ58347.1 heme exporter protein CcmD [Roseibium album]CTQ66239.1 heme exporter protein CcmD [Roseibium album]CTQ71223.1 heme exporter protein CcmD [Roseibium album]
MELGTHAGFIIASYALCILTVLVLVAWVRIDKANQERALKELAEQGISRARRVHESR